MEETTQSIPDKLFFKIGDVSKIADTKPHVLRYWESEFGILQPVKSKSGQRVYRRKDVELVLQIKNLLHSQGYTIEGAKKKLKEREVIPEESGGQLNLALDKGKLKETIMELKEELRNIVEILGEAP